MYRLMVVEDEDMIRKGIVLGVPWAELGFEVVGEGRNGRDALTKLETLSVDVVLTDIKMPVMSGVEFSKELRKQFPEIEIVILSGYSDFEYARQAISFRAFEYLSKPTNQNDLVKTFRAIKEKMDKLREKREENIYLSAYLNADHLAKRNEFLIELLNGDGRDIEHIEDQMAALELNISGKHFTSAILRFDKNCIENKLEEVWGKDRKLLLFSYQNVLDEILSEVESAYTVIREENEINFIFCLESSKNLEQIMVRTLENASAYIKKFLYNNEQIPYTIGIGLTYSSYLQLFKSFHQAEKAIQKNFYKNEQPIQIFQDELESNFEQKWIQYYPDEITDVVGAVHIGNIEAAEKLLIQMFQHMSEVKVLPEMIKNYCIILFQMTIVDIPIEDKKEKFDEKEYLNIVRTSLSVQALKSYVIPFFCSITNEVNQITGGQTQQHNATIAQVKDYIKLHYSEKISLQEISEQFYLSPNYLSCLFKKRTGMTYMDYIQRVRMRKAKELLKDPSWKVYEIAEKIGYNDYKYFALQFKKYTGATPKEYRHQK